MTVRARRQRLLVGGCSLPKLVDLRGSSKQLHLNHGNGITSSWAEGGSARRNQTCSNVPSHSVPSSHMIRLLDELWEKSNLDTSDSAELGWTSNGAPSQKETKRKKLESSASIPAVEKQSNNLTQMQSDKLFWITYPMMMTLQRRKSLCHKFQTPIANTPSSVLLMERRSLTSRPAHEAEVDDIMPGYHADVCTGNSSPMWGMKPFQQQCQERNLKICCVIFMFLTTAVFRRMTDLQKWGHFWHHWMNVGCCSNHLVVTFHILCGVCAYQRVVYNNKVKHEQQWACQWSSERCPERR